MSENQKIREQVVALLTWQDAHVGYDRALEGLPEKLRGERPKGMAHSVWEIVEHLRLAQEDMLDFSRNPKYEERTWPDEYWPKSPRPNDAAAWRSSLKAFHADLDAFCALMRDPANDLYEPFKWGSGQTLLREALVIADHNAYHVGEIVAVRRALGAWG